MLRVIGRGVAELRARIPSFLVAEELTASNGCSEKGIGVAENRSSLVQWSIPFTIFR